MNPRVNKLLDFVERVGWTAIYALAAAVLTVLTSNDIGWQEGAKFIGTAVALAVVKVILAQRVGSEGSGDAIPGGVRESP